MFTTGDLEMMRANMAGLQEIINKNTKDADYLEQHGIGLQYINELRENAIEATRILNRYIKLMDSLKLQIYQFSKLKGE